MSGDGCTTNGSNFESTVVRFAADNPVTCAVGVKSLVSSISATAALGSTSQHKSNDKIAECSRLRGVAEQLAARTSTAASGGALHRPECITMAAVSTQCTDSTANERASVALDAVHKKGQVAFHLGEHMSLKLPGARDGARRRRLHGSAQQEARRSAGRG
jgi:hypothetical protein